MCECIECSAEEDDQTEERPGQDTTPPGCREWETRVSHTSCYCIYIYACTCIPQTMQCVLLCLILCRPTSRLISLWPKIILEVDNDWDLPLHQACRQGNSDVVAILLQQDQPQKDIELIQLARFCLDLKYWYVCVHVQCIYIVRCTRTGLTCTCTCTGIYSM